MTFNTVSMVKHPIDRVWTIMRDDLPKLVDLIDDIEDISVQSYEKRNHNCKVVNVWRASPPLPQSIAGRLDSSMFIWTDRADWNDKNKECLWSIEHHHFRDRIRCSGTTRFESAIGGRGTRITFSGSFELNHHNLPGMLRSLEGPALKAIENLISSLIPKNFHKIADALSTHLDSQKR